MNDDSASTNRRRFLKTSLGMLSLPALLPQQAEAAINEPGAPLPETVGPVLGHIDESRICCFVRPKQPGKVTLVLKDGTGKLVTRQEATADPANDLCTHFRLENLKPDTSFIGEFLGENGQPLFADADFRARTAKPSTAEQKVVLAMGSCVSNTSFDNLWKQVGDQRPDGFCLLGDTPYIDSNDLQKNRAARRMLWGHLPSLGLLAKRIPFWNTWDDHDFGKNDSDGLMPRKENIRQVFLEYNSLASYGEEGKGIYTSFRRGPVEVWLIDDRWFSQTEASWADPAQRTCIGKTQWEWLKRTLKASTAPFKILCTGMVWYPKGGKEKDHWETYSSEREAIYSFIKDEKISGVVLVSGDIHVSRHHNYGKERLGYALHECVVSPMHDSIIPSLDVPHSARVWSKPEPNVFMTFAADSKTLEATWINMRGDKLHSFKVNARDLRA
ncbi:alkaline phosphatase family protein [Luteolibacter ambystomatis]|uniref:Alkaline phosphatase family protein n=1 Tax=Luteolibacter ambystomatis TaxID=2824561 RepID=A0A975J1L1_9BACT|nr:alkaline phosphatase D family protein [Luteolibacter ambystomatis]QUE52353.1 alkaline phosphatase family protein [Luteolibacter ambystomatis]